MAWEHLSLTKPHVVYIILGGFTSLFMLCSSVIKERMYIGEAAVATLCGVIFGPHAAGLIDPISWGNVDIVTIEFSRLVLVIQCFAIGVELPKYYMEKHWKSVAILLVPVMTFGWLVVSLIVWWMVPSLNWLDSLVVSACLTPTDPVLASSVVGKGKFAKRVPRHLRDLLSAESGCNDGMAFPFVYLALYLISGHLEAKTVTFHWMCYTILYECIFGAFLGFIIGYLARHAIKYSEEHDLIDRESFLVFYFVLSLFCAGVGSILGVDDLLLGFAAGVGFSNDGWFSEKTEESHVSNVIDLILNISYFVFLGTIIPWQDYNNVAMGLSAWRLCVLAILVILFRRLPIMLAMKPFIPDIQTWRETLFAGHFGPMGVGAVFIALLARGELETGHAVPSAELPDESHPKYHLIRLIWPIVTFIVIASIIIHGSSIAVFTLGKRINTLSLTMSYTKGDEEGPSWMNRLPRLTSQSRSQMKSTASSMEGVDMPQFPPGTLPPIGLPNHFLRRQKEEEAGGSSSREGSRAPSVVSRKRRKKWDEGVGPGGPVQQSAIFPERRAPTVPASEPSSMTEKNVATETPPGGSGSVTPSKASEPDDRGRPTFITSSRQHSPAVSVYEQGSKLIFETPDGDVLAVRDSQPSPDHVALSGGGGADADVAAERAHLGAKEAEEKLAEKQRPLEKFEWSVEYLRNRMEEAYRQNREKRKGKPKEERVHEPALAYQYGNTVIVEDKDGEVIKTYDLPTDKPEAATASPMLRYIGLSSKAGKMRASEPSVAQGSGAVPASEAGPSTAAAGAGVGAGVDNDDRQIRFTISGEGKRMNEVDFVRAVRKLDPRTRREVVENSSASLAVKRLASMDVSPRNLAETDPAAAAIAIAAVRGGSTPGDSFGSGSGEEAAPSGEAGRVAGAAGGAGEEETPAERRRREAALGMTEVEDDSDEEVEPRVAPQRRGIRFADVMERKAER